MEGFQNTVAAPSTLTNPNIRQEKQKLNRSQRIPEQLHIVSGKLDMLPASTYTGARTEDKTSSKEIYFSPISLNKTSAKLSAPLLPPTTTQYVEAEDIWIAAAATLPPQEQPFEDCDGKLTLRGRDLDRLIFALANAPIIRNYIQAETTVPAYRVTPAYPLTWPLSKQAINRILDAEDLAAEREYCTRLVTPPPSDCTDSPVDLTGPTRPAFAGLAFTEPAVDAPGLTFWSPRRTPQSEICYTGENHYLQISVNNAAPSDCCLKIKTDAVEPGKPRVKVLMQLATDLLVRKTRERIYTMFTEVDVTKSFRNSAFAELVEQGGCNRSDVVLDVTESDETVMLSPVSEHRRPHNNTEKMVDAATELISNLEPENCSMQTLTLMSELARIKRKYQDCVVLRCYDHHENDVPASMSMPWISQHSEEARSKKGHIISDNNMATFELGMIKIAGSRSISPQPFTEEVRMAGETKSVYFVPLVEVASEKTAGWVCFVRDISDVGL